MSRDVLVYIVDILECIEKIEQYTAGIDRVEFLENVQVQDAVYRRLEVIGEAVKGIPQDVRARYPEIPWSQIAGLRDVLIHGYFGVKVDRIWKVIEDDVPVLKLAISRMKQDLANG